MTLDGRLCPECTHEVQVFDTGSGQALRWLEHGRLSDRYTTPPADWHAVTLRTHERQKIRDKAAA